MRRFFQQELHYRVGLNLLVLSRCTRELCWHYVVVVVVLVAMEVRTKSSQKNFDGVLLSQKHTNFCKAV